MRKSFIGRIRMMRNEIFTHALDEFFREYSSEAKRMDFHRRNNKLVEERH